MVSSKNGTGNNSTNGKADRNGTFSILRFAGGVGCLGWGFRFGNGGIGYGVEKLRFSTVKGWSLGKFDISVPFSPTFPFVPLLPVPLLPMLFLLVLFLPKIVQNHALVL